MVGSLAPVTISCFTQLDVHSTSYSDSDMRHLFRSLQGCCPLLHQGEMSLAHGLWSHSQWLMGLAAAQGSWCSSQDSWKSLQLAYLFLSPPLCSYYLTFLFRSSSSLLSSWYPGSIPTHLVHVDKMSEWRWLPQLGQTTCGSLSYTQKSPGGRQGELRKLQLYCILQVEKGMIEPSFITFSELIWYFEEHNFCLEEQMHECERGDVTLASLSLRPLCPRFAWQAFST